MRRTLRHLKEAFKRHLVKPATKRLFDLCPSMQSEILSSSVWKTMSHYIIYIIAACTVCLAVWTLYPISSSGEVVTLALSSNEMIKAVYKDAYENPDGTVDLVFNIPRGGKSLLRLNSLNLNNTSLAAGDRPGNGTTEETTTAGAKQPEVKTKYPISLDADYAINTVHVCPKGQQVDYLIIVHSATAYFSRRRTIRETYGGRGLFGNIFQRVVFLLGTTTDPVVTKSIQEEAFYHRDIVQGQFLDSYHNLTHKGVLGFRWISEQCPQAKIVIKIDDDVFINPFKLVQDVIPTYINKTRHIACHLRPGGTSPIVRGKGKWQVHEDEFRGQKTYPFDYCNGYFVIITSDLIRPMLNAARLNPFFWIDDVYLFGSLPATVGSTKFINIRDILSLSFKSGRKCYEEHGMDCKFVAISQWKSEEPETLWYLILSNLTESVRTDLNVFGLSSLH